MVQDGHLQKAAPTLVSVAAWQVHLKPIEELPAHDRKAVLKMIDAMADSRRRASEAISS